MSDEKLEIKLGKWFGQLGTIDYWALGTEDHGLWGVDIGIDFHSTHQGLGYIALDRPVYGSDKKFKGRKVVPCAGQFLHDLAEVIGAPMQEWKGKRVMALREDLNWGSYIKGIARGDGSKHIIIEDWFRDHGL